MPKVLFYFRTHFDDAANQGVVKKCKAIAAAFPGSDTVYFMDNGIWLNQTPLLEQPMPKRSLRHIWAYYAQSDCLLSTLDMGQYDLLWVRHAPAHPRTVWLFRRLKRRFPQLKIMVELPTWPYDAEPKHGLIQQLAAWIDRRYRIRMAQWVDHFIHYGTETTILGRPAIALDNGIEVASVPCRRVRPARSPQLLRLLAVGSWSAWHGLDRLIEGIGQYHAGNPTCKVRLDIIGDGPALADWKKLVAQWNLTEWVHFEPPCHGAELDARFEQADVAVGSLGLHRLGLQQAAPLKHREYGARAIPFIFSGIDRDFPDTYPFALAFPPDDTPILVSRVVHFYEVLYRFYPDYAAMRAHAEAQLDWTRKLDLVGTILGIRYYFRF